MVIGVNEAIHMGKRIQLQLSLHMSGICYEKKKKRSCCCPPPPAFAYVAALSLFGVERGLIQLVSSSYDIRVYSSIKVHNLNVCLDWVDFRLYEIYRAHLIRSLARRKIQKSIRDSSLLKTSLDLILIMAIRSSSLVNLFRGHPISLPPGKDQIGNQIAEEDGRHRSDGGLH
ncbi:hypothetical protein L6452_13888 [Arctium lappa]|uniref:Uncharacterized protein n=1 Tax=Arctium lappa TaxID=4217 RepID=A0ACB9CJR5_ARCLA|nr:hypothetical protein L6452_13888 [Arctium lappa]